MRTPELELASPAEVGLCPERWARVLEAAAQLCASQRVPALALQVQRRGRTTGVHSFGTRRLDQQAPCARDDLFLIASLTKPLVAMGVMLLVERGQLCLNQRVAHWLPELDDSGKRSLTIRHLLTHTSGLPDMLPNNVELRQAHAPLARFVAETCRTPLAFPPGRGAVYQSMGYALLGPIMDRVAGQSYSDFLRAELFEPLGMHDTWLGVENAFSHENRLVEVRVPPALQEGASWNWNSPYWRRLGAPWGGGVSTAGDLSRFCGAMLARDQSSLFSAATIRMATANRLQDFSGLAEGERRTRGWGLGWRLNWKDHRAGFSDLLDAEVVGHWGACGTLMWIDQRREIAAVLLSSEPLGRDVSPLTGLSNLIAAAFSE